MSLPLHTRTLAAVGALTLALGLSACSSSPAAGEQQSTATATPEQTESATPLVVYSGRDEGLVAPLIEKFEAASGVDVEVRYGGTTELAAQLLEEGDRTPAHVFLSQDAGALGALADAGLFVTLPGSITSAVAPQYTSTDGTWVGVTGRARVVAYDSQQLTADEVPTDLAELTDPRWRSQVAIAPTNASFQTFVTALRETAGEQAAQAWLEGLVANDVQVFEKNGAILEAVDAGTVQLGLINHYYWAGHEQDPTTLRAQLAFGAPGTVDALVNVTGAGILAGGTQHPAATELLAYLVGDEAQTYFVEETHEYPLVEGVGSPAHVPPLAELGGPDLDLARLASLEQTVALLTQVGLV